MDDLARLVAIEDIRQLKARYFRLMDCRDFRGMADLFTVDAVFDCSEGSILVDLAGRRRGVEGPVVRGRDAIVDWIAHAFATRASVHHGHAHEVTIEGPDAASGIVAMADYILAPDRRTLLIHAAGHYTERYARDGGAWRIAATRLTRLFRDDGPHRA